MRTMLGAVVAAFMLATGARAADPPQELAAAIAACEAAKASVPLRLEEADPRAGKPFVFGTKFTLAIAVPSSQALRSLTVWVAGKRELQIEGGELQSFVNDGVYTPISFVPTPVSSAKRAVAEHYLLPLMPGEQNK